MEKYKYIIDQLNWSQNAKNQCAKNIRTAFMIDKPLGDAYEWIKYIDSNNPEVGFVAVMGKDSKGLNSEGKKYGHVAVITEIDGDNIRLFDGPNAYHFWTNKSNINGYISVEGMIKLGSKIKLINNIIIENMGEYEKIFYKEYPNGSTIFKDLKSAKDKFGDIVFFIAIGLERNIKK